MKRICEMKQSRGIPFKISHITLISNDTEAILRCDEDWYYLNAGTYSPLTNGYKHGDITVSNVDKSMPYQHDIFVRSENKIQLQEGELIVFKQE